MDMIIYPLAAFLGYICGSIPFAWLMTRWAGLGDIRQIGSGNPGATNVLRTGRKGLAASVLALDMLKGTLPVFLCFFVFDWNMQAALLAGLFAVLGHMFPVWLRFKGGKSVATALGALLGIQPWLFLALGVTWLVTAFAFRISSLAGLVTFALAPFYAWLFGFDMVAVGLVLLMAGFIITRHHANIRRLLRGEEPKIGQKKAAD